MASVLRFARYLVALAAFVGGVYVLSTHLASPPGEGEERPPFLELLKEGTRGKEAAKWLALGLALAAAGLFLARPPFKLRIGRGLAAPVRSQDLRALAFDIRHPNVETRLYSAKRLTGAARPETVPALIQGLRDPDVRVRGQACEALAEITGGLTLDFVDIAPVEVREASVRQWEAWWQENKSKLLAGRSGTSGGTDLRAAKEKPSAAARRETARRPAEPQVPEGPYAPTEPKSKARGLSIGELSRRRKQKESGIMPPPGEEEAGAGAEAPQNERKTPPRGTRVDDSSEDIAPPEGFTPPY